MNTNPENEEASELGNYRDLVERQRADQADRFLPAVRRLTWSAERLAKERERRLRELLVWSADRSKFWRKRLEGHDLSTFTEADLPKLEVLTKNDLMANFDDIVTDPYLSIERVNSYINRLDGDAYLDDQYRVVVTSGTGGMRGVFVYGWDEWITYSLIATRWRGRSGEDPYTPVGTLFASDTKHVSGALHAFSRDYSGHGLISVTHLPASLPMPEIVAGLNASRPTMLTGYPSAVHLLALESLEGRLDIKPKWVTTSGEQLTNEIKDAVRAAWDVEIYDTWGCTEGVFAFPCRPGAPMHLPDDLAIIEPVDENGVTVPFGEPAAKILLTNLYNRTQPLIRYEIHDAMTITNEPCECGSNHRQIIDIKGRTDTYFAYDNGAIVHRLGMKNVLLGDPHVVEVQVKQTPNGIVVSLVTRGECDMESLRVKLTNLMERAGLVDPDVAIIKVDSLERMWSGKLRQFEPLTR